MRSISLTIFSGSYELPVCGVYALAAVPQLHFIKEQEEVEEEIYSEYSKVNTNKATVPVSYSLQPIIAFFRIL